MSTQPTLRSVPTGHPAASTLAAKPRAERNGLARRRSQAAAIEAHSCADLAELLERAVELNRNRALDRDIRIACTVMDALLVLGDEHALLESLDAMLANAVANTVWGSRIECLAGPARDRVVVRIRFLKPGCDQSAWSVDDGELCGTWVAAGSARYQ